MYPLHYVVHLTLENKCTSLVLNIEYVGHKLKFVSYISLLRSFDILIALIL